MRGAALILAVLPLCAQVQTIRGYRFNIAPYTPGDVSNFGDLPPEIAPDPVKNACWTSPNYFFDICKAAETAEFPAGESGGVIRPIYSRWRNDNADGSLYFVVKNGETPPGSGSGQMVIYRTANNSVFRVVSDVPSQEAYEFRWDYSGKYPYRLYHIDDACGFHRYDISPDGLSATDTLIRDFARDFSGCGRILNDVEGDSSGDSRYWAFMVNGPYGERGCEGNYYLKAITVYDREADRILGVLDRARFVALGGAAADWDACGYRPNMVDMSPLGTKVVALWPRTDRQDFFDGPHAYNKDFNGSPVKVCNDETHSGWGFDLDGSELFVCQIDNRNWPGRAADTVAATNIATGVTRVILFHSDMQFETGYHFGRIYNPEIRGWVLVTTSSNTATASSFLRNHAFFLELRSSEEHPRIWRVADLHNNYDEQSEGAYYREAYAALSGDGRRFYWGADWVTSAQGAPGSLRVTSTGVVNTYAVTLPPKWWELLTKSGSICCVRRQP